MSTWAIVIVTAMYLYVCAEQLWLQRYGFSLMWFSYALANCGVMMEMSK